MGWEMSIMIAVAIVMVTYLVGNGDPQYQSPFLSLVSSLGTNEQAAGNFLSQILAIFSNTTFLSLLGIAAFVAIAFAGSTSVVIIFPVFLAIVLINFFILPINFIFSASYDPTIKLLFGGLLNTFIVVGIAQFVRSG